MGSNSGAQQPLTTQILTGDPSQQKTASWDSDEDDPSTPSITYSTTTDLFKAIAVVQRASGDALRVEGVTSEIFGRILNARSESQKFTFFFSEPHQLLIVTIPSGPHEHAALAISQHIYINIWQMNLQRGIINSASELFGSAPGQQPKGPGEPDGSWTPTLPSGDLPPWPSVVVEVGKSHSMAILRLKAARWLIQSSYAVRAVILVKIGPQQGIITIEKWRGVESEGRPGATTTRASAAATREPDCVQTVGISRTGVGTGDMARLDPNSYTVVRGPLRLAFADLFLRDPEPGEYDIIFEDEVLQNLAVDVSRERGARQ